MSYYSQTEFQDVPKTIGEFLERGWDKKIIYRIRKFTLRDVLNQQEELLQDIVLSLIETDYLSRYSPEKGNFEVYIYIFVDNFLKRRYCKENTRYGKGIVNRASLESSLPPNTDDFSRDVIYLETLEFSKVQDESVQVLMSEQLSEVREELSKFKASSSTIYNGQVIQRDPLTVFDMILEDKSVAEIAEIFATSKQFIYNLIKKIRQTKGMSELRSAINRN